MPPGLWLWATTLVISANGAEASHSASGRRVSRDDARRPSPCASAESRDRANQKLVHSNRHPPSSPIFLPGHFFANSGPAPSGL